MASRLTDADRVFVNEGELRHSQILRRWPFADPACRVVVGTVTRAEETTDPVRPEIRRRHLESTQRHTAQVGAHDRYRVDPVIIAEQGHGPSSGNVGLTRGQ